MPQLNIPMKGLRHVCACVVPLHELTGRMPFQQLIMSHSFTIVLLMFTILKHRNMAVLSTVLFTTRCFLCVVALEPAE